MTKILGLDLGTNSIGWAIVDKEGSDFSLVDKGVRIFSEGVNIEAKTASESSKAAKRTGYRSARKLKYRRKIRKINVLKVLSDNNFCPPILDEELHTWRYKKIYPQNDELRQWLHTDNQADEHERKQQKKNPYYYRYIASKEVFDLNNKQDRYILGRALYHLAQRRGFLSNRLDNSENSIIEEKSFDISAIINESNSIAEFSEHFNEFLTSYDKTENTDKPLFTLNRAFERIIKENKGLSLKETKVKLEERLNKKEFLGPVKRAISDLSEKIKESNCSTLGEYFYKVYEQGGKIRGEHTDRNAHYLIEFEAICTKQRLPDLLKEKLKEAIFFQRPLKSQKGLVAKCPLENRKRCVPISHPSFEEFRMLSYLNTIKIKLPNDDKLRFLNLEERSLIRTLFFRKSRVNFDFSDIAKKITPKNLKYGFYKDKNVAEYDVLFNYNLRSNVTGCPTIANLIAVFGEDWKDYLQLYYAKKDKKTIEQIVDDIWHVLFRFDQEDMLRQFAKNNLGCNEKNALKFSKINLKQGYGSLSLKAIRNILPYLRGNVIYSHAVFLANMTNVLPKEIWKNQENKQIISNEINSILESHKVYSNKINIVNGLIKKNSNGTWNSNNPFVIESYQKNIEQQVKDFYGDKNWNKKSELEQKKIIEDCFLLLSKQMKLNSGRGEFAKKKTIDELLKTFLDDNFNIDRADLEKLYHPSAIEVYKKTKGHEDGKLYLESPLISSIKNPMAMRSLHQLKKVVNQLIKDELIDESTIVHIEMPRELNSANQRTAIRQWQDDLSKSRATHKKEIKAIFNGEVKTANCNDSFKPEYEPTEQDILKYQLWIEQNKVCLYTGKTICLSEFIGKNPKFDVEHTIPRSRSLDNSQVNKTLCCATYNRQIKKDRIPFECENHPEILLRIKHWYTKCKNLEAQINGLSKKVRAASTKERKDKYIVDRTKLKFEHSYLLKKYNSFTMEEVPNGFKNSQLVDIGIISKYGNMFLKTVFPKVFTVKGKTTANLRKMWGLPDKIRDNHAHHAKDAVIVACCSRDINDALANYYHQLELFNYYGKPKPSFAHRIPWKGFTHDVNAFDTNTLISHHTPDILAKQSKKTIRKKGIIQRNKNGEIIYKQGDTVRGSLHKETFYGAIKREVIDKKTGNTEEVIKYVKRQSIDLFKDTDLKNIVDDRIKEIVIHARALEKELKKEIELLIKQLRNAVEKDEQPLKDAIQVIENKISNELYVLPNKNGPSIPIKKIRYYTNDVSKPLFIKKHRDVSRHKHKQFYHAKNDSNYCMALYSGKNAKGKKEMAFELVNNIEAGNFFRLKNKKDRNADRILFLPEKHLETGFNLCYRNNKPIVLKKGLSVILLKEEDSIDFNDSELVLNRFYRIIGLDTDGIKLLYHSDARGSSEAISHMNNEINKIKLQDVENELRSLGSFVYFQNKFNDENIKKVEFFKELNDFFLKNNIEDDKGKIRKIKESKLTTPKGGDVIDNHKKFPYIKFKVSNFDALIEGIDFNISSIGEIKKI